MKPFRVHPPFIKDSRRNRQTPPKPCLITNETSIKSKSRLLSVLIASALLSFPPAPLKAADTAHTITYDGSVPLTPIAGLAGSKIIAYSSPQLRDTDTNTTIINYTRSGSNDPDHVYRMASLPSQATTSL
jgi:hypothetical protein